MMSHAFNPTPQRLREEECLSWRLTWTIQNTFQACLGYRIRSCLKQQQRENKKRKLCKVLEQNKQLFQNMKPAETYFSDQTKSKSE